MDEIIYNVYAETFGSSPYPSVTRYIAALQDGKNTEPLKGKISEDSLERLAGTLGSEIFKFHRKSREYREVCLSFDLPYTFKVGRDGMTKPVHDLLELDQEKFWICFQQAYRQQDQQLDNKQTLRPPGAVP